MSALLEPQVQPVLSSTTKKRIVVFGSAHLDIIATERGQGPRKFGVDIPGDIDFDFGGGGANAAITLAQNGIFTTFCSVFKKGGLSHLIVNHLENAGVHVEPFFLDGIPQGGFCAIVKNGDIKQAVTSAPVEDHLFERPFIATVCQKADAILIDGNLNEQSVKNIVDFSRDYRIDVYYLAVSEAKIGGAFVCDWIKAMFMNVAEYRALCRLLANDLGANDVPLVQTAKTLNTTMVVSCGIDGVVFAEKKENDIDEKMTIAAVDPERFSNTLGAGDALAGGTIARILNGLSLYDSIKKTVDTDIRRVLSQKNCHTGQEDAMTGLISNVLEVANIDTLTKLETRSFGLRNLRKMIDDARHHGTNLTIVYCDVDKFKTLNDTYGHNFGDNVLKNVASVIKDTIRETDHAVRMGGDEFLLAIKNCTQEQTFWIVDRIYQRIEQLRFRPSGDGDLLQQEVGVSVSLGVTVFEKTMTLENLIEIADKKMYQNKKTKCGR